MSEGGIFMMIDNNKINLLLANRCMSINKLAEASGVDKVTISRIRNGSQKPRPKTLGKIARALKTDVENLISR